MHPIVRLAREYGWKRRASYLGGVVAMLATNGIAVRIPIELGRGIDAIATGGVVWTHAAWITVMGACLMGVRTLSRVLFFNPGRDVEYEIRRDIFARLLRLQPSFYATHKRGDLISRASNDITWARLALGFGLLAVVNVSTAFLLTGGQMLLLSPTLTLLVLAPLLVALLIVHLCIQALMDSQRAFQAETGLLSDQVLGSLQGIATIQGFVAEEAFLKRLDVRNHRLLELTIRMSWLRSVAFPLLVLASSSAIAILVGVGGPMALAGTITVGEVAAFAALLATLAGPLRSLGWMLSVVQQSRAALERIFELLDAPIERPERESGATPLALPAGRGPGFRIRGLSYAYPDEPDRLVLEGIDLDIRPGEVVGLFGRTGSGKSTLIRLLARVFNPQPGMVAVLGPDGASADLTRLDLDAWRDRLAVVPQRPFLFSESIARNIALQEPLDRAAAQRAAEQAALGPDLRQFAQGLDTVVGERGIMLSGGQRQRVALARGLAREADLVVLDDVLSAVDQEAEARLVESLVQHARGPRTPTTFIVSHRLSALRRADRILVLDQGHLVDQGTHAELVGRPGPYREAWQLQNEGAAEVEESPAASATLGEAAP